MSAVAKRLGHYARTARPLHLSSRPHRPCAAAIQAAWQQQQPQQQQQQQQRSFSITRAVRKAEEEDKEEAAEAEQEVDHEFEHFKQIFGDDIPNKGMAMNELLRDVDPEELRGFVEPKQAPPRGFWGEGEPEVGEDEEWAGDDISSLGHGELEQQREIREYMRMAAWELPLLTKYAKPFEPPTSAKPLRFRYTTYMGEQHPAANKVVVEFSVNDIPDLTQVQQNKLIKLAGPRYNPDTSIIKISAENFETQAMNKRYLGDRISDLIAEARNPKDTFEDVPFDFRHHKPKVFHHFPKEWVLTPERKQLLDQRREERWMKEQQRIEEGTLVDGADIVKEALSTPVFERAEPVLIEKGKAAQPRRPTTLGAR